MRLVLGWICARCETATVGPATTNAGACRADRAGQHPLAYRACKRDEPTLECFDKALGVFLFNDPRQPWVVRSGESTQLISGRPESDREPKPLHK